MSEARGLRRPDVRIAAVALDEHPAGRSTTWADQAEERLVAAGHRRGGARRAVIDLLAAQPCAMTAREIDDLLRRDGRAVGRASVYRALEQLAELKLVTRLEVGQGMARYERAQPGGEHHHHMVCDSCGAVEPFEDAELERAITRLSDRVASFRVAEHDVVLHGECSDCRS